MLAVQTRANANLHAANTELAVANTKVTRANADLAASNERERARFALAQEAIRTFHTGVSEDVLLKQKEFKALRTKLLRGAREFYQKLEGLLQGHEDRESRLALGRAYFQVGELTRQLDSIEEAQKVHRRALALFEALSRENPADAEPQRALALSLKSLSIILMSVGRRDEALAVSGRSRELSRTVAEADPGDRQLRGEWARGERFYAMSLASSHRPAGEVLAAVERARSTLEAAIEAEPQSEYLQPELAEGYGALALALEAAGRPGDALAAYNRARDLGEALFRAKPEDPGTGHELVRNLGNLGIFLRESTRPAEALAAFDRAREVLEALRDANPTLILLPVASAWIDASGAEALVALGLDAEALRALERARAAREILIKANPSMTRNREQLIRVHRQVADIHQRAGRTSEALASFERAREIAASLVDAHPGNRDWRLDLLAIYTDLGDLLGAMHKPTEALSYFDQALVIGRQLVEADSSTPSHPSNLADTLRRRGIVLQRCGRPAEAVSNFRQSIAVLRGQKAANAGDYYTVARAKSLLSAVAPEAGSGLTADDGRAAADEAMGTLRRAIAAGWPDAASIKTDSDLDPIRSRGDFQLLMLDMAFPNEPFARVR